MTQIVFLADAGDIHTVRWANALVRQGVSVIVLSSQLIEKKNYIDPKVTVIQLPYSGALGYYLNAFKVKRLIRKIKPDLLHAHYATGYGTLARLVGFHPTVTSVWGSDILTFPHKSVFHRNLLKKNLRFADHLASTSVVMKSEILKLITPHNPVAITPFGVDCEKFVPIYNLRPRSEFVIGAVKKLEPIYGIDTLIKVFARVKRDYKGSLKLRLKIVGKGSLKNELQLLAEKLGVAEFTEFCGYIPHDKLPRVFNTFSVAVVLSRMESFGVSALEASACGIPVVVSNVGGLPEVVVNMETGFIVDSYDTESAAAAINKLLCNIELAKKMGISGRRYVMQTYEWRNSVARMLNLYSVVLRQPLVSQPLAPVGDL